MLPEVDLAQLPEMQPAESLMRVDLEQAPLEPFRARRDGQYTKGDLHGNFINAVHFMVQEGVMVLPSYPEPISFATVELYPDLVGSPDKWFKSTYDELYYLYSLPTEDLTRAHIDRLQEIINHAELNPAACLRFIGDELADRGKNDYFMLVLMEKVIDSQDVPFISLASNHSMGFVGDILRVNPRFRSGDVSHHQAGSITAVEQLLERDAISSRRVRQLAEKYLSSVRLFDYSLGVDNQISVYTHAPTGPNSILVAADYYGIDYQLPLSTADLARVIDDINKKFQLDLQSGHFYEVFRQQAENYQEYSEDFFRDLPELVAQFYEDKELPVPCDQRHILYHLLWNRDTHANLSTESKEFIKAGKLDANVALTLVHGHNGQRYLGRNTLHSTRRNRVDIFNVDSELGKEDKTKGTYCCYRVCERLSDKQLLPTQEEFFDHTWKLITEAYADEDCPGYQDFVEEHVKPFFEQIEQISEDPLVQRALLRWITGTLLNRATFEDSHPAQLCESWAIPPENVNALKPIYYLGKLLYLKERYSAYREEASFDAIREWYDDAIALINSLLSVENIPATSHIIRAIENMERESFFNPRPLQPEALQAAGVTEQQRLQLVALFAKSSQICETKLQALLDEQDSKYAQDKEPKGLRTIASGKASSKPLTSIRSHLHEAAIHYNDAMHGLGEQVFQDGHLTLKQKSKVIRFIHKFAIVDNYDFNGDIGQYLIQHYQIDAQHPIIDNMRQLQANIKAQQSIDTFIDCAEAWHSGMKKVGFWCCGYSPPADVKRLQKLLETSFFPYLKSIIAEVEPIGTITKEKLEQIKDLLEVIQDSNFDFLKNEEFEDDTHGYRSSAARRFERLNNIIDEAIAGIELSLGEDIELTQVFEPLAQQAGIQLGAD